MVLNYVLLLIAIDHRVRACARRLCALAFTYIYVGICFSATCTQIHLAHTARCTSLCCSPHSASSAILCCHLSVDWQQQHPPSSSRPVRHHYRRRGLHQLFHTRSSVPTMACTEDMAAAATPVSNAIVLVYSRIQQHIHVVVFCLPSFCCCCCCCCSSPGSQEDYCINNHCGQTQLKIEQQFFSGTSECWVLCEIAVLLLLATRAACCVCWCLVCLLVGGCAESCKIPTTDINNCVTVYPSPRAINLDYALCKHAVSDLQTTAPGRAGAKFARMCL